MTTKNSLAVIVVNYRTPHHAIECIHSLLDEKQHVGDFEIILVDNASGDGSVGIMRDKLGGSIKSGVVTLLPLDMNGGFGWANNQAILMLLNRELPPAYVMLLNPDCTIKPGAIQFLRDELDAHDDCAVGGSQLLNPDGSWTGSAFRFPTIGREFVRGTRVAAIGRLLGILPTLVISKTSCEADWVTGASCLLRVKSLIEEGLFDDGFFLYFEEVELMHRFKRAGWTIRHVPTSLVYHIGGASTGLREGKTVSTPSFPLYWFQSRSRFLTLAYGATSSSLASMAWVAGVLINRILGFFRLTQTQPSDLLDIQQMYRSWSVSKGLVVAPSIPCIGDPAGKPPQWMADTLITSKAR